MDNRERARAYLDAPKRWLSWASLGNVSHAWERFPVNALGVQPESRATICGVGSPVPAAWISGPGITRCPECARIEAEQLAAEFAAIRREALEEAVQECDTMADAFVVAGTPSKPIAEARQWAAQSCASEIRDLATPTKPGDETKCEPSST